MKNTYKKPLKILILTDKLSLGGAETHILTLCSGLEALGHSVTVISSGGALENTVRHKKIDIEIYQIYFRNKSIRHTNIIFLFFKFNKNKRRMQYQYSI